MTPLQALLLKSYRDLAVILDHVLDAIEDLIRPGVTTRELDRATEALLARYKVESSFKGYRGYPAFLTTSVNEEVVNTLPSKRVLKSGDLLKLQMGLKDGTGYSYQAWTYPVGDLSEDDRELIQTGLQALRLGVRAAVEGGPVHEISRAIQTTMERGGGSVNREYLGHGMGQLQHEPPQIPCYVAADSKLFPYPLPEGKLLSIQVIAHAGTHRVKTLKDGWNVVTVDGRKAILFSQIVAVRKEEPEILTRERSSPEDPHPSAGRPAKP